MSELRTSEQSPVRNILKDFLRAQMIVEHVRVVRAYPGWARVGHRLIVGWRCPACKAFANGEHEGWGLKV